jgi:hypothetical protein
MATTVAARKAKGRRAQQAIRDLILEAFSELEPDDVRSVPGGCSGADIQLSPAAKKVFPFSVESKNCEKLNIWQALEQCEKNTEDGLTPLLIFKRNHSKLYATIEFDALLNILIKTLARDD